MSFFELLALIPLGYATPFCLFLGWLGICALLYRPPRGQSSSYRHRLLVVIPAHNEQAVISKTLQHLTLQSYGREWFQVVTIADNCTDATAELADQHGFLVWQRQNPEEKSKGHALAWAFAKIQNGEAGPWDAIVVLDADTLADPQLLYWFNNYLSCGFDWIQGYYNGSNPEASWRTQLLSYALSLINGTYLAGQSCQGVSVALRGNGMCFSKRGLSRYPWQASTLAEDIEFAWKLRLAGERVHFAPQARVYGELVSGGHEGAKTQRQRWEVGRRLLRSLFSKQILQQSELTVWAKALALVDLWMVPLARLGVALILACGLLSLASGGSWLWGWCGALFMLLCVYGLSPLVTGYIKARYLLALVHVPRYMLWKLPLLLRKPPKKWLRTQREDSQHEI